MVVVDSLTDVEYSVNTMALQKLSPNLFYSVAVFTKFTKVGFVQDN